MPSVAKNLVHAFLLHQRPGCSIIRLIISSATQKTAIILLLLDVLFLLKEARKEYHLFVFESRSGLRQVWRPTRLVSVSPPGPRWNDRSVWDDRAFVWSLRYKTNTVKRTNESPTVTEFVAVCASVIQIYPNTQNPLDPVQVMSTNPMA